MPGSMEYLADTFNAHTESDVLLRRAKRLRNTTVGWSGILYRAAEPKYAKRDDRLDGIGACMNGGRWNPPGMHAVYGASSPEAAMAETLAIFRHYGLPVHRGMPRVFFAFEAKQLKRMLDLTDGKVRQRLRVSSERMRACPWRADTAEHREALTQAIGRAALLAGFQGLVVGSTASPKDRNVVLFPAASGVPQRLHTLDAATLKG